MDGNNILTGRLWFPPPEAANEEGMLAIGGDLSPERLLLAYRNGIFPWYEGPVPLWWNPDPRFVIFPSELYVSKSMKQVLNRNLFDLTCNQCFDEVILQCEKKERPGQDGTWISKDIRKAYGALHLLGHAHSFEAWQAGQLVGGLYGIRLGNVFFGESMFSHVSNASKAAFIGAVRQMEATGLQLIDCQVYTPHLESLGGKFIPRKDFLGLLKDHLAETLF